MSGILYFIIKYTVIYFDIHVIVINVKINYFKNLLQDKKTQARIE